MKNKSALVTGVSSGLGHAFALELLTKGYEVYGLSRTAPNDLLGKEGFHFQACDLSQFSNVSQCLLELLGTTEWLDLVILNAGKIGDLKKLADCSLEEIQTVMDTNVWANKFVLDHLIHQSIKVSQVIAISSGASVNGSKGWSGYSLSKATLNMLIQLYSNELEDTHFTALAPGLVLTNMLEGLLARKDREKFPSLNRLNESQKQSPAEAASKIVERLSELKAHPSGSFLDLRDLIGQKSF